MEYARSLGISVAVNIIADPSWDEARFAVVREWMLSVPEIVHLTVNTPYPGTETWTTDARDLATRNYKLFDVQHAVLPTSAAAGEILRGAGQDPADPLQEAHGLAGAPRAAPRSPRAISCAARPTS